MKRRLRPLNSLMILVFSLGLLSACGGSGSNGVAGLWESEEWGGICIELREGGAGTIYTYEDVSEITYTWDGETLRLVADEDGSEATGELQEDGSIGIMGLGYFYKVETRSYGPDMAGSSFTETGGMESELEGDWIHSSSNLMLNFDGRSSVTFQDLRGGGYASSGWYSYDGETVSVDLASGIYEGYIDWEGDLIIEIDGEGGWYSRGDSAQLTYPDVTGPEAELVGYWKNDVTGDYVEFASDGSVVYSIGGGLGVASPFSFDGETVAFSDYTGYIDSYGDLILNGVEHWFSLSQDQDDGAYEDSYEVGYSLGGAYDNDNAEMSIVFHSDGTATVSDFYSSEAATYTVDGDYLVVEFNSGGYYEAYYDSSDDTFQVDGLDGWFYYVGEAWYTPG